MYSRGDLKEKLSATAFKSILKKLEVLDVEKKTKQASRVLRRLDFADRSSMEVAVSAYWDEVEAREPEIEP